MYESIASVLKLQVETSLGVTKNWTKINKHFGMEHQQIVNKCQNVSELNYNEKLLKRDEIDRPLTKFEM